MAHSLSPWFLMLAVSASACDGSPPNNPTSNATQQRPEPVKSEPRTPLPDGQGSANLSGAWSGTVASTPELEFGGPPYCFYTTQFTNLRSTVEISAGRVVSARVTATHVERSIRGCPYAPDPPIGHTYTLNSATIADRKLAIRYDAAPANHQTAAVDFDGEISADGRSIGGTLTVQRVDQPSAPNLQWRMTIPLTMAAQAP
jgi:hypothetical protein